MRTLTTIGFDADDTLWDHEKYFVDSKRRFLELLAPYVDAVLLEERLHQTETANVSIYGFGVKSFTLSMIEAALATCGGELPSAAFQERLLGIDPGLKDVSFAAETYDAVTLAALAAAKAEDDSGRSIAANLIAVSGGTAAGKDGGTATVPGTPCPSYKECLAAKASGTGINYDGESGPVAFDANGDITSATFTVFTYGADNNPTPTGRETAGRAG